MTTETKTGPRTRSGADAPVVPPRRPGTGNQGAGSGGGGGGGGFRGSNARRPLGAAILVLVPIVAFFVYMLSPEPEPEPEPDPTPVPIVVTGMGGGLKANFLNDPEVQRILAEDYGLTVDAEGDWLDRDAEQGVRRGIR